MPAMSTSEIFLIALTIILAVPYAFWRLLRTDHYAPLVVVQIVGGIILGPGVLGAVVGFWLGSSFTTSRSRGLGATPTQ